MGKKEARGIQQQEPFFPGGTALRMSEHCMVGSIGRKVPMYVVPTTTTVYPATSSSGQAEEEEETVVALLARIGKPRVIGKHREREILYVYYL